MAPPSSDTQTAKIRLKFWTPINKKAKSNRPAAKNTLLRRTVALIVNFPSIFYLAIMRKIDRKASLVMSNVRSL